MQSLHKQRPLISVIILTWNRCDLLLEALGSLREQDFGDWEILIVDDGSDDGTAGQLNGAWPLPVRYFRVEHCGHIARLRNLGLAQTIGEHVCFLDSDDLWLPEKLRVQIGAMQRYPAADFSFCGYETFDGTSSARVQTYRQIADIGAEISLRSVYQDLMSGAIAVYPSSLLIKRYAIERARGFDENFRVGDYDLLARLAFDGEAVIVHTPLVRIRKHAGNLSVQMEPVDLREAIAIVERQFRLGRIPRHVHDERLLKYRGELMRSLFVRADLKGAAEQVSACSQLMAAWESHETS